MSAAGEAHMANAVSLIFLAAALALAGGMTLWLRPKAGKLLAALAAGLVIAALNFLVERFGAAHGIYYVRGLWPVGASALSWSAAWVFFTLAFALGSELARRRRHPKISLAVYVLLGIAAGILSDYLGQVRTGHFQLGPNGNWLEIALVWIMLTPLAILLFRLLAPRARLDASSGP